MGLLPSPRLHLPLLTVLGLCMLLLLLLLCLLLRILRHLLPLLVLLDLLDFDSELHVLLASIGYHQHRRCSRSPSAWNAAAADIPQIDRKGWSSWLRPHRPREAQR